MFYCPRSGDAIDLSILVGRFFLPETSRDGERRFAEDSIAKARRGFSLAFNMRDAGCVQTRAAANTRLAYVRAVDLSYRELAHEPSLPISLCGIIL